MPVAKVTEGVRVKQSAAIDYTKLPIDNCYIPLLITGGEALDLCLEGAAARRTAIETRKKLLAKIKRALTPKRGVMPPKTKIALEELRTNFVQVRIEFEIPKSRSRDRDESKKQVAVIQGLYRSFVEGHKALKLNQHPWDSGGRGVQFCKVAFDVSTEEGKRLKKLVAEADQPLPDSGSLARQILAVEEGKSDINWWVRSDRPHVPGRGIPMRTPAVHQAGDYWFFMLPAREEKLPAEIYLPRGTFKRLTMSQYWKLLEKAGLED